MKAETKLTLLFFIGCLMCLMLTCYFTPTVHQREETEFQERIDDTTLINHSEIQVQELSESEMYYRMIEPHFLNND